MEVVKALLESYGLLVKVGPRLRELDASSFEHVERAAKEVAAALTSMRMRVKLDPQVEDEVEKALNPF